jgi:hypothetical protein
MFRVFYRQGRRTVRVFSEFFRIPEYVDVLAAVTDEIAIASRTARTLPSIFRTQNEHATNNSITILGINLIGARVVATSINQIIESIHEHCHHQCLW